jgi:hypothetical protein
MRRGSVLLVTAVVDADAGLLGAFIGAGLTAIELAFAGDAFAGRHGAEAAGTGTLVFVGALAVSVGWLSHAIIIAAAEVRIRLG